IIFSEIIHILFLKKCFALLKGVCGNNRLFIYGKIRFLLSLITKYVITGTSWYNKYRSNIERKYDNEKIF
ncbi:hypothetical protein, partial [Bacillus wiedmannii]|uniref:hypothetical protein n=1 Tax=Bacillus wiedmannii TaxID=1890302 RepID=UPI001C3F342F